MRAVAVLTVFADHLFGWPSGGFVGVDIFFVLSGFFITGLLLRERTTTRALSFSNFYIRRVKRILPSAVLVIVVTVTLAQYLFPASRAKETLLDGLWAAVFAANIRFETVGADYFQQGQPPSPLQHYWSLSIEEQFYFVWPAVLVFIFFLTRRATRHGRPDIRQRGLFLAMAIIVAASFAWAMDQSAHDPNAAYFSTFTRIWELGIGALIAIAGPWLERMPHSIRPALSYAGLGGVVASLFLINSTVQFPAPWASLPVLSAALVVASFHGAEVRNVQLLTNPVARWFGDTSYTLYLWHWPVIILLGTVIAEGTLFYLIALVLALALTAVTYHFYENPIRQSNWLMDDPRRRRRSNRRGRRLAASASIWGVVGLIAASAVVTAILGIRYDQNMETISAETEQAAASTVNRNPVAEKFDPCLGAPAMTNPDCRLRNPDTDLKPGVDKFAIDLQGQSECYRKTGEPLKTCTYGYQGADAKRIALVGDSHAAAILPAIWRSLVTNKWQLTTYVGANCAWQLPHLNDCPIEEIQDRLLTKPYDLVVTTSWARDGGTPANFAKAWEPIAAAGTPIVAIADNPTASDDSLACLTRVSIGGDRTGDCGTAKSDAYPHEDPLPGAVQLVPGAKLIDLSQYYCDSDRCPTIIGDVIVYRDGHHLTATFAQTLQPMVVDVIKASLR